ncbi:hypothetical protein [Bartonella sp. MM100QHHN]|uniref:hypothetical protein n=1 Tax=Bartonella sp. MM100QHHN TaxID=3243550 RepID=UPI0035CF1E21
MWNELYDHVCDVGRSNNLPLLISTERKIVKNDLFRYANSKSMAGSLRTALAEIDVIKDHVMIVSDPKQYDIINRGHNLPKLRKNGLPYDAARRAMASHYTRLKNLDKGRLTDIEKSILDMRMNNMKVMRKIYENMQAKAINLYTNNQYRRET